VLSGVRNRFFAGVSAVELLKNPLFLRKSITISLLCLAVIFILQLPFSIHNSVLTGRLCGPSTAADAVLALGNTIEAPPGGREPGLPAGAMEYPESYNAAMQKSAAGNSVASQMFDWLCRDPLSFLELQLRKVILFWDYREIPNNVSLYGEGNQSLILRCLLLGRSALVLSLSLGGLIFSLGRLFRRHESKIILLYATVVLYWFSVAVFYNLSRFRAPIIPVAVSGAALLLCEAELCFREKDSLLRRRKSAVLLLCFAAAAWIVISSYEFYRSNIEYLAMRAVRPHGNAIIVDGKVRRVFDHGPMTFGGWIAEDIKSGMRIGKRFVHPQTPAAGEADIFLIAEDPAFISWSCGSNASTQLLKRGENHLLIPFVSDRSGFFEISFAKVSGGRVAVFYDSQRDYGRSTLGGEAINGEWVIRIGTEK
jgi:hypothetical protein